MIKRYSLDDMEKIFSIESQYEYFLTVELAHLKALSTLGYVKYDDYLLVKSKAKIDIKRIEELENITKHDVIAFTRSITENLGKEGNFFHYGLTSTDIVDTANSLKLKKANDIIMDDLLKFLETLKNQALKYKYTKIIGRTHGIRAEVTSFGLKFLNWYDELLSDIEVFKLARKNIEVAMLSGAVGNYTIVPFEVEGLVASDLGLNTCKTSTQVLSRNRHVLYLDSIALIASLIEKIATEIRHLSRSEVNEVKESFKKGQKGSSAMPHKKNPIASENMCGLSRLIRSYSNVALENNILWHERDISHSSNERIILMDSCMLLHYMLKRYKIELDNLLVDENKMLENILSSKDIFSSKILSKLILKGYSRDIAYDLVQDLIFSSSNNKCDLKLYLEKNFTNHLTIKEIDEIFNIDNYLVNIDKIYKRVLEA